MWGSRLIGERNCQSYVRSESVCSPVFCVLIFVCSRHTKRRPDAQDAPTDDTLNSPLPTQILLFINKLPFPQRENRMAGGTVLWWGR